MKRTMESVAAERLNKIGKNPSMVSTRADLEEDQSAINQIVSATPLHSDSDTDGEKGKGAMVCRDGGMVCREGGYGL